MKSIRIVALLSMLMVSTVVAAEQTTPPATPHVALSETDLKWGDAPPNLPKGAKVAVLSGDPSKAEPFVLRVRFPAGYRIAPHWHPTTEHVTVLAGTIHLGMGETFDIEKATSLFAGAFAVTPAEMRHFAWTKDGATIQVHGVGPFDLNYVNPADDPSKAAAAK